MAARRMALVFDLDGTLVDSVYQHVVAWHHALLANGIELSIWRIHRRIGMRRRAVHAGAAARDRPRVRPGPPGAAAPAHAEAYNKMSGDCGRCQVPWRSCAAHRGRLPWGIATSGRMETAGPVLAKLGVPDGVPIITRDMVAHAKPIQTSSWPASTSWVSIRPASTWWATASGTFWLHAGRHLGIGLLSGGYGTEELERAGAYRVYDDPAMLLTHLDELGVRER